MRIAHISDVHWCEKHRAEVSRVAWYTHGWLSTARPDAIVISGDLFDHRLEQNSPALLEAIKWVHDLADIAPVLILQGTLSHDAPRALDVFKFIEGEFPIHVADRIEQVVYHAGLMAFDSSGGWSFEKVDAGAMALFSCLPSVNKGAVAAAAGAEKAAGAVGEHVLNLLRGWAPVHEQARAQGIPTVVVSHGTVSGCVTEHGVPMAGLDHEYTTGALFAANADAVMLGHIHKHQAWGQNRQTIAYPGSLGRLHFGEIDPKGFLIWTFGQLEYPELEFIETPAKRLIDIEYQGAPDMQDLAAKAVNLAGAHVRIRYSVDEEHRHSIDRKAITAMFEGAEEVKIEARINPVQRQRSAGIVTAASAADRLRHWCEYTNTETAPLQERLAVLDVWEAEKIVADIMGERIIPARDTELAELDDAMERGDPSAFRQAQACADAMEDF